MGPLAGMDVVTKIKILTLAENRTKVFYLVQKLLNFNSSCIFIVQNLICSIQFVYMRLGFLDKVSYVSF
jgi:hypothetical protein